MAVRLTRGEFSWKAEGGDDWNTEVARFFAGLAALDQSLAADDSLRGLVERPVEKLIQGTTGRCADARGPARDAARHGRGARPARKLRAGRHVIGRVGMDQTPARAEFDGDASVRS